METKEIKLTDDDIKRFKLDKLKKEAGLIKSKSALKRMEKWLENDYARKNFEKGIVEMQKIVDNKVDAEGKEVDELSIEDFKIQLELRKEELEQDLPCKELRIAIEDARDKIQMEEANIKKIERFIRDKKTTVTQ